MFDALFEDYSFARHNPMSIAMQAVLDVLHEHHIDKEADTLQAMYDSVKLRAEGIDSAETTPEAKTQAKQKLVVELYDKFFRNAFPRMTERLGIVYTPVEVVDFIIHSVQHILQTEFGQTLGSKGVHILDPFTGTGTFITRLLQGGLITRDELPHKYRHEIHANEIVLLAYYIAAINIEAVYHGIMNTPQHLPPRHSGLDPESSHANDGAQSAPLDTRLRGYDETTVGNVPYQPFEGICLTDTFQMYEKDDLVDALLVDNSARRKRQKKLDIRVILGNPPYSAGQESANDNNQNLAYPQLDRRIEETYAAHSNAANVRNMYDSYIRAIRWASDRIGNAGVIGFVTNAGWLDANTADGLRQCLAEEFSSIHVFHLRGNARTSGEQRRKEKDNVFGSGSRAPIAISLLVKNPNAQPHGRIHFHDIGDYLSRDDKLEKIAAFHSIVGISTNNAWQTIIPDAHGDWLRQRDTGFNMFIALGNKKGDGIKLFDNFSQGVLTARDAWCYNASKIAVTGNMTRMIDFYNSEVARCDVTHLKLEKKTHDAQINNFINNDLRKISWTRALKKELVKNRHFSFEPESLTISMYRPFTKQWLYFNRQLNEYIFQMPRIFPGAVVENRVICVSGIGARSFSTMITNTLPSFDNVEKGQCFPLYLYDPVVPAQAGTQATLDLIEEKPLDSRLRGNDDERRGNGNERLENDGDGRGGGGYVRRDAITDEGLAHFQQAYPHETIGKEDIFYYVYGLLHSKDYRSRFADNLSKELPRIPRRENRR